MAIKTKVVSIELCRRMLNQGIKKPAKYWYSDSRGDGVLLYVGNGGYPALVANEMAAYDLSELMDMLPGNFQLTKYREEWSCSIGKTAMHGTLEFSSKDSAEDAVAMAVLQLRSMRVI